MKIAYIAPIFFLAILCALRPIAKEADKQYLTAHCGQKTYTLDTDASAVVIFEKGAVEITKGKAGYKEVYTVHRAIKILKTTGFAFSTVKETYLNTATAPAKIKKVSGTTYNLENGTIKETKLETPAATQAGSYTELAFTMPGVKTGSVIEYEYEIASPLHDVLPMWEFMNRVPKLSSEYAITAPAAMEFTELSAGSFHIKPPKGEDSFVVKTMKEENGNKVTTWSATGSPAYPKLKPEPFINNLDNFKETLVVAVGKDYNGKETNAGWKTLNDELMAHEYFGGILKASDKRVQFVVDSITKNDKTPLAKARSIFNYARLNFDYNNNEGIYSRRPINQVFANRIASEAEINLVMAAMMRMAGLQASAVILSKLNTPPAYPYLPLASQFNYTVAMLRVDTMSYLIDGSNFFNAFGFLPVFCYNGYARVISETGSDVWLTCDGFKDRNIQQVNISQVTDTSFVAEVTDSKGRIEGSYLRNIIGGRDTTAYERYVRKRSQPFAGNITILGGDAENLFDPEKNLVLKYTVKITRPKGAPMNINANILKFFSSNPFSAPIRYLPMEFPTKYEYSYTMTVQVPRGMEATYTSPPTMGDIAIKGLENTHDITYDKAAQVVTVKARLDIARNTFLPNEYAALQFFFDQMVGQETAVITLKNKLK